MVALGRARARAGGVEPAWPCFDVVRSLSLQGKGLLLGPLKGQKRTGDPAG